MVDFDQLDLTANAVAQAIRQEFPEWTSKLEVVGEDEVSFEVSQPDGKYSFSLRAGHGKVSMSYGDWGFVIGTFLGRTDAELAADAVHLLRGIVTEEQFATVFLQEGQWMGSSLQYSLFPVEAKPGMTSRAYSWLGTYDQMVTEPFE